MKIDSRALVSNWRWLAAQSGSASCGAAVKADGYGLGARETVQHLAEAGCRDFFVSTWAEAEALLPWPEGLALSVLHGVGNQDMEAALASPARPILSTAQQAARWKETGAGRPCDVMVDTGMNRLGLSPEDLRSGAIAGLAVETLMSHLACADEPGHPLNEEQLRRFGSIVAEMPARRYSLANSGGICLGTRFAFDLTRPGLALYGGVPVPGDRRQEMAIAQVVSVEAQLLQIREVPAGATVGYGATYKARRPVRIGILNIGYADGYLRGLAAHGFAQLADQRFPVVGRVSMDLLAVELGQPGTPGPAEGDWLSIGYRLSDLARASALSQYELLTTLGSRFRRSWS